jgi:hypothetical protein
MADEARLQEIVGRAQSVYEEGIKVIQDMSGWTKIDSGNEEVVCFRRPNDTSFDTFKAEYFVDKAPQAVARYTFEQWGVLNAELQAEDIESFDCVKKLNDDVSIYHGITKNKGPVDGRSLIVSSIFLDLGNNTFAVVGSSVEDESIALPGGKVRGEVILGVALYEPVAGDATRTHVQTITHVDPKGSIPATVVNSLLGNRAVFYAKLKDRVASAL